MISLFQAEKTFKLITEHTLSERSCCPSGTQWEIRNHNKSYIWKLHMWWAETLLWEICCFCSPITLAELFFFFPRNQVPHCYVAKVNNDSLNDPRKKNWRLAPLKGIWTGKSDNVTNHSSKYYLKNFSLNWDSQQHAETTALHGCAVIFKQSIIFPPSDKDQYRKSYISERLCEELGRSIATAGLISARNTVLKRPALSLDGLHQFYLM